MLAPADSDIPDRFPENQIDPAPKIPSPKMSIAMMVVVSLMENVAAWQGMHITLFAGKTIAVAPMVLASK